ncbi:MAG TPA: cytochrome c oxidase subunit II, partial [Bacteroidia bacterium]|nr:cytochrome c oxidase subunit II [Bacteroidia bacterium]
MHYLIYIILILAAAAIWQLVRVVELSTKLKGVDPNKVTESDNRMQGRLLLLFYFLLMGFCFWQYFEYKDKLLPVAGSEHGLKTDWLLNFNFIVIIIVFIITNFLLFYMGFKYYGRDGQRATYFPHNNKLEMLWTGVPAVVLFVIIFLGIRLWNDTMSLAPKGTRVIELYAQQFNWKARYSGKDNELGKSNYRLINETNELGLDSTDAAGYDDFIVADTLFLPVNEEVDFEMRSRDVLHSAYFPYFRAQMNVVPGMQTYFHFKPIKTTAEMRKDPSVIKLMADVNATRVEEGKDKVDFDYLLLCNKICGASHFSMQLKIVVGTKAEYDAWVKRHKPFYDG